MTDATGTEPWEGDGAGGAPTDAQLAWAAADEPEPEVVARYAATTEALERLYRPARRVSWPLVLSVAVAMVTCGTATALAITAGHRSPPSPQSPPAAVITSPVTVTTTAPAVTVTAQPPPITVAASAPTNDQAFLDRLSTDGLGMMAKDTRGTLQVARQICTALTQGTTKTQASRWLADTWPMNPDGATLFVNDATASYPDCKQGADPPPRPTLPPGVCLNAQGIPIPVPIPGYPLPGHDYGPCADDTGR